VIYYTGLHPYTLKPIKTVKTREEKLNQNRFFFWYKRENKDWIKNRLTQAKRPDLIEKLLGEDAAKEEQVPRWLSEKRKNKN
jgi:hypothetical protein